MPSTKYICSRKCRKNAITFHKANADEAICVKIIHHLLKRQNTHFSFVSAPRVNWVTWQVGFEDDSRVNGNEFSDMIAKRGLRGELRISRCPFHFEIRSSEFHSTNDCLLWNRSWERFNLQLIFYQIDSIARLQPSYLSSKQAIFKPRVRD